MEEVSTFERVIDPSSKSRCASATAAAVLAATGAATATPSEKGQAGKHGKIFSAQLLPQNAGEHSVGEVTFAIPMAGGTLAVRVRGDEVTVTINVHAVTPMILHPQYIHAGTICPTASDDANGDGFVDVIEGLPKMRTDSYPPGQHPQQLRTLAGLPDVELHGELPLQSKVESEMICLGLHLQLVAGVVNVKVSWSGEPVQSGRGIFTLTGNVLSYT